MSNSPDTARTIGRMSDPPIVRVVAAVIRRNDEFLITHRFANAHLGGLWEFPGGKVEEGEGLTAALTREIEEEIGIDIEVAGELLRDSHAYPDRTVRIHFFECRILAGEPVARGVAAFRWVQLDELFETAFPEANRALLEKMRDVYG
jgi:8-oxo-dGTP diphosphatase